MANHQDPTTPCGDYATHRRFAESPWDCPTCAAQVREMVNQATPVWAEKLVKDVSEMRKRMVRVETRATNAMRSMGLIPNEDPSEQRPSKAVFDGHALIVTGLDVQVRDLARAAVLSGEYGEIPIYFNNRQLGVINVHHTIRSEVRDD